MVTQTAKPYRTALAPQKGKPSDFANLTLPSHFRCCWGGVFFCLTLYFQRPPTFPLPWPFLLYEGEKNREKRSKNVYHHSYSLYLSLHTHAHNHTYTHLYTHYSQFLSMLDSVQQHSDLQESGSRSSNHSSNQTSISSQIWTVTVWFEHKQQIPVIIWNISVWNNCRTSYFWCFMCSM